MPAIDMINFQCGIHGPQMNGTITVTALPRSWTRATTEADTRDIVAMGFTYV